MKKSGVTPSKAAREEFKPAAPFKFADDFDWLVPDDYEVNMCLLDWISCVVTCLDPLHKYKDSEYAIRFNYCTILMHR